ncbi:MAG: hypothetical protein Q7K45_02065 [Nanoarchaeota archaeon]|nr:hypothetical protein [Nanoarchaeota archaeon]
MAYVIKLYVVNYDENSKVPKFKTDADESEYRLEIKDVARYPFLQGDEKIMPLSRWRRALPRAAAELVRKMEMQIQVLGMDFQYEMA